MKITRPPKPESAHFNALFYGSTGVGKTTLLGSAQDCEATSPMLLIDVDGGLLSLAGKKIDVVRPTNFSQLQEIYDFLREDNDKYKSVGIDSVTEEQRVISMGSIMKDVDDDLAYKDLGRETVPHRQDWLKSAQQMRKLIRGFRDLSYRRDPDKRLHVFMTALEKMDEKSGYGCPALPGVLALEAGGYVDVLARLVIRRRTDPETEKSTEARFLHTREYTTQDDVTFLGKNRLGRLGKGVWNPTIDSLIKLWTK